MTSIIRSLAWTLVVCMPVVATAEEVKAFYNIPVGDKVADASLPTLDGKKVPLLDKDGATVLVFFRTEQEFSERVLAQMAELHGKMGDKPVHWVGIVSDTYPRKEVSELVKRSGVKFPIAIDKADKLYGLFGVVLHPSIGVVKKDRTLSAYVPFRKVNFASVLEAHVQHTLGEIDDTRLAAVLDPPKAQEGGDTAKAQRNLRMGEMLYKMKKFDKAAEIAAKSIAIDPQLAAAHALLAASHAAQGKCKEAKPEVALALKLDPEDARAQEAKKACEPNKS